MKIVIIGDTHSKHRGMAPLPDGDMLIHVGDFTDSGKINELGSFNKWLGELSFAHKVIIAGNHDCCFERDRSLSREMLTGCVYLEDSFVEIDGLKIYGSPWTPASGTNYVFNLVGDAGKRRWSFIPDDVDLLITHGPPLGFLDTVERGNIGCPFLYEAVTRIRPKLHIFGHIHEGYGKMEWKGTTYINASSSNGDCNLVNSPIVIDI